MNRIAAENIKMFETLEEAAAAGYGQCKCCAPIYKYLRAEKAEIDEFCKANGMFYWFDRSDGALNIKTPRGAWKIIVKRQSKNILLYHKNTQIGAKIEDSIIPGFHSQKCKRSTLMGYLRYINTHDRNKTGKTYEEIISEKHYRKGSKKWRKHQNAEKAKTKSRKTREVLDLIEALESKRKNT